MRSKSTKKLVAALATATALLLSSTIGASACTAIFAGGDLTADSAPIVARSEDYVNSMNKLFIVNEAGKYQQGEKFIGCPAYGGFEWTWTHDSYRFLSFTADNVYDGVCPECGQGSLESPVTHDSYTESGYNEKGVTVSATETLYGNDAVYAADPLRQDKVDGKVGIEETDIPTVILAEAATAREGVELLCDIYDEYGCYYASGLFIADQNEIWYIENCSGSQYVALKLPSDILFLEPNMAVIGRVDLDDANNIIASDRLIEVAKQAGTFVGNESENIIDFRASYAKISMDDRLVNGLNFINASYNYTADQLSADNTLFTISNLDKDNNIITLYTNIKADRELTVDDIVNYYKVDGIGRVRNVDTAFFQIFSEEDRSAELGTVEWVAMNHCGYNVFVPYYPMLTTELYEGYGVGTPVAQFVTTEPAQGLYYATTQSSWAQNDAGEWYRVYTDGYMVFPEGWEESLFWCFDVLSNYIESMDDSCADYVLNRFDSLQNQFYDELAALDLSDPKTAASVATEASKDMAKRAHELALELAKYVTVADGELTRALLVDTLYSLEGKPAAKTAAAFSDTNSAAVSWAVENGIVSGVSADSFAPDAKVTREQLAVILWRYAQYKGMDVSVGENTNILSYEDAFSISEWAIPAVQWAAGAGLLSDTNGVFAPQSAANNAAVAQMLEQF